MKLITRKKIVIPKEFKQYFDLLYRRLRKGADNSEYFTADTDIYLMEDRDLLKIGKSYDFKERFKTHSSSNKFARIVKVYRSDSKLEKYLHNKLESCLVTGEVEWFHTYKGIYDDIDSYVEDYEITKDLKRANLGDLLKHYPFKVYKFKDLYSQDLAFVIARNKTKAHEVLLKESFLKVSLLGVKEISDVSCNLDELRVGEEYIYYSNLKTRLEYLYCKKLKIDYYKEYGKTSPRRSREYISEHLSEIIDKEDHGSFKEARVKYLA